LQKVLRAARGITHPEARCDSARGQCVRQSAKRAIDEGVGRGDSRGSSRPKFLTMPSYTEPEVDPRLDDIPSVDDQNRRVLMALDDRAHALRDHREKPRRLSRELRHAIEVETIAIQPGVDQRAGE